MLNRTTVLLAAASLLAQPAAAEPKNYRISVPASAETTAGDTGAISITIAARADYTISREGPGR